MHGQQAPSVRLRESNSGKVAHAVERRVCVCMHCMCRKRHICMLLIVTLSTFITCGHSTFWGPAKIASRC